MKPRSPARVAVGVVGAALGIAYPFLVYFGLEQTSPAMIAVVVLAICVLRLVIVYRWRGSASLHGSTNIAAIALIALALAAIVTDSSGYLLWHPVLMNLVLFLIFSRSLRQPPSLIERFASLRHGELPGPARIYCRRVTLFWSGFFVVNGTIACLTVIVGNPRLWLVYNGMVSYGLIGLAFVVEFGIRIRYRRKHQALAAHGVAGGRDPVGP